MAKEVTLTIDGRKVTVPEGTLVVDAAKIAGVDIPVFCYHPKMEPVGMCRMCLVEIGRPVIDRATGKPVLDENGEPQIRFFPKLETACTNPVSEGMVVKTTTEKAKQGRKEILEFLLTSHPLDCPVCDKGGECALQNLTIEYGPTESRFRFEEKHHAEKRVPLGDKIILDRERCIQCGRCIRFQSEVVGEAVLAFDQRGRNTEVVTYSDPPFDSIFSGNTTDLCPVGALTTTKFRFGARPWEMQSTASICEECAVGCNITFNTRRDAKRGGVPVIKRVMPRQNEEVNEIWICDKGRFAYPTEKTRLTMPKVNGKDASWEDALSLAAEKLSAAKQDAVILASGRLSNEDLFNLKSLADEMGARALLYTGRGGGEATRRAGIVAGTNLADLGEGDAILVLASDLYNEAPLWWLRVKQASDRGAALFVATESPTRLDAFASKVIRVEVGKESDVLKDAAVKEAFAKASNGLIFFGGEGVSETNALADSCAAFLESNGHIGKPNNGLIGVWSHANDQGAWEMGFEAVADIAAALKGKTVYFAGTEVDSALAEALGGAAFVVVQSVFEGESLPDSAVLLPAQDFSEREGSFTSGERRVQRFYAALPPAGESRPGYLITAQLAEKMNLSLEGDSAESVFARLAAKVAVFSALSYEKLAEVKPQFPLMSRGDLYYGGTVYENTQGLGVHLAPGS